MHGRHLRGHIVVYRDMAGGFVELGPHGRGTGIAQCSHRYMAVVLFKDSLTLCAAQHSMGHYGAHVYLLLGFMGGAGRAESCLANHQHVSSVGMGSRQKRLFPAAPPLPCGVGCYRSHDDYPHGSGVLAAGYRAPAVGKPRQTLTKLRLLYRGLKHTLGSGSVHFRLQSGNRRLHTSPFRELFLRVAEQPFMHGSPANICGHLAGVLPILGTAPVGTHSRAFTVVYVVAPLPQNTPQQEVGHQHNLGHLLCPCFRGVILHDEAPVFHGVLSVHAYQPYRRNSEHKAVDSQPLC